MFSFHRCRITIAAMFCLLVFAGCAPSPRGGLPIEAINQTLEEPGTLEAKPEVPPLPPEISSALIPDGQMLMPNAMQDAVRFDIAASQVAARDFFMSLVEGSPINMVVHPDVAGEISVDLKNTTIEEVLQVIHNVYGYPYFQTGNIYQVMPAGLQTQTFQVNYLNLVRSGMSQTRVSSGQVTQSNDSDTDDNNNNSNNGSTSGSQIDTESTADFWTELRGAIQNLVGSEDGRKVVVQPQASVVAVVAMPDELRLVGEYLKTIQNNLQRQVVIEAKVIEVSLSDGFQSGINWAVLGEPGSGKSILAGQTGGGSVFDSGYSESEGNSGNLTPGDVLQDGLDSLSFGGVFSLALNFNDFQGFVEMLESQGDVQVLSSPRISTINNQKAVIKVGSDEYFVTDISSDTNTGTTTTSSNDITLTPFFSGIALDVTPQIDAQGRITLHIHPTVSEVVDQNKQINAFGVNQSIPVAYSTIRESDSVVYANSGQLVVIGGLMKDNTEKEESGVPLLSDIPGVGALFRHTKSVSRKSELVILLRPQVIVSPDDWQRSLDVSRQRVNQISPKFQQNWRQF
ncbi:MSHA biogenesis protein MshL [Desulfuromusa kysingii]|uniref:MSHA biogenesis protein MshL n=1 Tax=Desulfuromusa kysingii TaxID=37625 RepID=A0A1H3WVI0_9BACT|nr:pilus (MSHA type) biogenesis protein MshL [Desulfuromusa kysingii]SDZ90342.1 MSHA biogenesis protein MshL [Desulfuromusa kysingii]